MMIPDFDTREQSSGLLDYLEKNELKYPYTVSQKEIGDVTIGNVAAIEIKRISSTHNDLKDSLFHDHRLYPQAKQRRDQFFLSITIIEITSRENMIDSTFTQKHFNSVEFSLEIDFRSIVYHTYSMRETVDLIYRIRDKIMKYPERREPSVSIPSKIPLSLHQKQMRLLSGLLDVGDKTSEILLERYKSPIKVFAAIISGEIDNVPGIGNKFIEKNRELLI